MSIYLIQIKNGARVLARFECISSDSCTAAAQHAGLAELLGGYLAVSPVRAGYRIGEVAA